MHTLNYRIALPLALLVLPACPISEKVGGNPSETSGGAETSSGTATDGPSSTESSGSTTEPTTGATTMIPGGQPSECTPPPCDETWTHVGDLVINGTTPTDQFNCMTRVTGYLNISDVDQQQLSGLRNLISVGDKITISSDTLTDLSPFSCLEEVTSELEIWGAPNLSDVSGLSALRRTKRFSMTLTAATTVPTFSPEFSGLEQIVIASNAALVDLAGMANWKAGESGVVAFIGGSPGLKSVAGLKPLLASSAMPLTRITLSELPALESLAGLEGFTQLLALELRTLPQIQDLAPLGQLKTIGTLDLTGMPLVKDLQGLSQLKTAERLTIGYCSADGASGSVNGMDGLTSLAGLSSLTTLGEFGVYDNDNLVTLAGADNLTSITQAWTELDNPTLAPATITAFADQVGLDPCTFDNQACICHEKEIDDITTGGV